MHALWFDGRSSRGSPVELQLLDGPLLEIRRADGLEPPLQLPPESLHWPEHLLARPRPAQVVLDLGDHGSLKIDDIRQLLLWQERLTARRRRSVDALQHRSGALLGLILVFAMTAFAAYRYGTPWLAKTLTPMVPTAWESEMAQQALRALDRSEFKPSQVPLDTQKRLRSEFEALVRAMPDTLHPHPGYRVAPQLEFRRGMGANALALPGGLVLVTDGLWEKAQGMPLGEEAVLGVLAHEWGHVVHRHGTRMAIEHGVLQVMAGLMLGDVSSLLSTSAVLLSGLSYGRQHEREADCFAWQLMRAQQRDTAPMGELLLRLDPDSPKEGERSPAWSAWLSTHPDTHERLQLMRSNQAGPCSAGLS